MHYAIEAVNDFLNSGELQSILERLRTKKDEAKSFYIFRNTITSKKLEAVEARMKGQSKVSFSQHLSNLLFDRDISQSNLCILADLEKGTLSKYMSGELTPDFVIVVRIALALRLTVEEAAMLLGKLNYGFGDRDMDGIIIGCIEQKIYNVNVANATLWFLSNRKYSLYTNKETRRRNYDKDEDWKLDIYE